MNSLEDVQPVVSQTDSSDSPRDDFAEDGDSTFAGEPNSFRLPHLHVFFLSQS